MLSCTLERPGVIIPAENMLYLTSYLTTSSALLHDAWAWAPGRGAVGAAGSCVGRRCFGREADRLREERRSHGEELTLGQIGNWHSSVPLVRSIKPLISNRRWTEWHTGKKKMSSWHTGVWKLFCGTHVNDIFLNSIGVKDSLLGVQLNGARPRRPASIAGTEGTCFLALLPCPLPTS